MSRYSTPVFLLSTWLLPVWLLGAGCAPEPPPQLDWPQFRGPGGSAVAEGQRLPTRWADDSDNIRWRTELPGVGNSSPVVAGGQVFVTAIEGGYMGVKKAKSVDPALEGDAADPDAADPNVAEPDVAEPEERDLARMLIALDAKTGEVRWRTEIFKAPPEFPHNLNTNAAPSPVTDGESVWVYFGSHLARVGVEGDLVWSREIDPKYSSHVRYGVASSPILAGDLVILYQDREWAETEDVGWLAAFDRETGEEVWRHQWSDACCSYTTPVLWQREARTDLVVAHSAATTGYDPATGEERWVYKHRMLQPVASPSTMGEVLCVFGGAHRNKGNACLRGIDEGDSTRIEEMWFERRRAPETASPVLVDGRIYALTEGGVFSAYDVLTGKAVWVNRVKEGKGFRASLVAGDGKLYARSTWGTTAVIATDGPKFEILATNILSQSGNNATPAVGAGCLLIRTAGSLVCIEPEDEAETPA